MARIVFADRSETTRRITNMVLTHNKHMVVTVSNPAQAEIIFSKKPELYDLWIIHAELNESEDESGHELAKKMHGVSPNLPILVLYDNNLEQETGIHYLSFLEWSVDRMGPEVERVLSKKPR